MKISNKVTGGGWQVAGAGRAENHVTCHASLVTGRILTPPPTPSPRPDGERVGVRGFELVNHWPPHPGPLLPWGRRGRKRGQCQAAPLVTCRAFTLVEIAICLAIIGIALVAIIGVLPRGLDVQRENRERTVINQDATVFMEAIRNGARGADDLTNYVYAIVITNDSGGGFGYINPALTSQMNFSQSILLSIFPTVNLPLQPILTNGANIVGLLGTLEYVNGNTDPNHIYAYVRSISGPAIEKPPQDNGLLLGDSFGYRIVSENVSVQSADINSDYAKDLQFNLHEVRQTFYWPILPNGQLPPRPTRQFFRTMIAGQIQTYSISASGPTLYFFQNQSFTNAP